MTEDNTLENRIGKQIYHSDDKGNKYFFKILRHLGNGGFGDIFEVEVKGHQKFEGFSRPVQRAALKIPRLDLPKAALNKAFHAIETETNVYKSFQHPIVVKMLLHGTTNVFGAEEPVPYIIQELLIPMLGDYPFAEARGKKRPQDPATSLDNFFHQLSLLPEILEHLFILDYQGNRMMRLPNLKYKAGQPYEPKNDDDILRIISNHAQTPVFIDLGHSQPREIVEKGLITDPVGTPEYVAHEVLLLEPEDPTPDISEKSEVYGLTCCFYEDLTGEQPYAKHLQGKKFSSPHERVKFILDLKYNERIASVSSGMENPPSAINLPLLMECLDRYTGDAKLIEGVVALVNAGMHPSKTHRLDIMGMIELATQYFQFQERVLTESGTFSYDMSRGIYVPQTSFKPLNPKRNLYRRTTQKVERLALERSPSDKIRKLSESSDQLPILDVDHAPSKDKTYDTTTKIKKSSFYDTPCDNDSSVTITNDSGIESTVNSHIDNSLDSEEGPLDSEVDKSSDPIDSFEDTKHFFGANYQKKKPAKKPPSDPHLVVD